MAILKVTNTNDSGNGSLRATIAGANAGDTIEFDAGLKGQTITLTSGELALTRDITIDGDIDGDHKADITISGNNNGRVFDISDGANTTIAATLESLTITDGRTSGSTNSGGGINVGENDALTLIDSTVSDNTSEGRGGGVYGASGASTAITVVNSTIADNYASNSGGGIAAGSYAAITLVNSTVSGNSTAARGGGIYGFQYNPITLYDSTVTGNYAGLTSGGVYNYGAFGGTTATTTLVNSIVAGNVGHGGANDLYGGYNSTAALVLSGSNIIGSAPVNFASTSGPSATQIDGTNQAALETVFASVANDPKTGVLSGVLGNNGGPTETVAIKSGGIADGTGSAAALPTEAALGVDVNGNGTIESTAISVDQIGKARVRGGGLDIGAVEAGPVVTTNSDSGDDQGFAGSLAADAADGGGLSLREAIHWAQAGDTITFDTSLKGQTITLSGQLGLGQDLTIDGDVNGDHKADITINGAGNGRVFNIDDGNANTTISATLESLVITGGSIAGNGGGIYVGGSDALTLTNSTVSGNSATSGGGIYGVASAGVTLVNSTMTNNSATNEGGGIFGAGYVAITLVNATVSGNSAGGSGGGIYGFVGNPITLYNSTVTGNHAGKYGGAIYNFSAAGATTLVNSIVAGNAAYTSGNDIFGGGTHALQPVGLRTAAISSARRRPTSSRPRGRPRPRSTAPTRPHLETVFASVANDPHTGVLSGVLGDNGGPTQTVAIKSGGIADGTGNVAALPTEAGLGVGVDVNGDGTVASTAISVDQTGFARVNGALDIGAVEAKPTLVVDTLDEAADGDYSAGHLSLREAISLVADGGTITFDSSLKGGTIRLTSGELALTRDVTIDGDVDGDHKADITISGDANGSGNPNPGDSRIFNISGSGTDVALSSLTLTNGYASSGGAIYSASGTFLDVTDSTITNSRAASGGGIFARGGLYLGNTTIADNFAAYGGGITVDGYSLLLNTTITGNTATGAANPGYGGGIETSGSHLYIYDSTIAGNKVYGYGGGLDLYKAARVGVSNSVIAGNTATGSGTDVSDSGAGTNTLTAASSFFGTDVSGLPNLTDNGGNQNNAGDPLLGPLGDHGGTVKTLAILAGSPLIGAGNAALLPIDVLDVDHDGTTSERLPIDANGNPRVEDVLDIGATQFTGQPQFFMSGDFNGDGIDDMAWRSRSSGYVATWLLNSSTHRTLVHPSNATSDWEALAPGDYNGDGIDDIAWRNTSSGYVSVWLMDKNGNRHAVHSGDASSAWQALAPGDFNGDGIDDIAWRNSSTGYVSVWLMDSNGHRHVVHSGDATSAWQALAPGDYNGDGIDDIAWRNSSTGYVSLWLMDKNGHRHVVHPSDATSDWQALAPGDYNGDGITDIAWRNTATGYVSVWLMDKNGHRHAVHSGDASSDWQALGSGDYNGDGIDDMAWRNTSTGYVSVWLMDKNGKRHFVHSGDATADWQALSPGDYNGDGITDIAWRNTSTGYVSVWQMDKNAHRHVVHPSDAPNIWQAV